MEAGLSEQAQSLSHQVTSLENRLMLRRRRVRALVEDINGKVAARLISPGTLLAAFGIGVAVEQISHHRAWSLATALDTANAFAGLLLALSSPAQQAGNSARRLHP
jgi:hypothetical protein